MNLVSAPVSVGIVVTSDTCASSALGLLELFRSVGAAWQFAVGREGRRDSERQRRFSPYLVAESPGLIEVAHGVVLQVGVGLRDAREASIVCIPELILGRSPPSPDSFEPWRNWLSVRFAEGSVLASYSSGVALLADSGLLDGLRASTHWGVADALARWYPEVKFDCSEALLTAGPDGRIVTAGAGSAWHDLALHLVARFTDVEEAMRVARLGLMQWHEISQVAWAELDRVPEISDAAIVRAIGWLREHFQESAPVGAAIKQAGLPERTFTRRFHLATGVSPLEFVHRLRLSRARQMLESSTLNVQTVARQLGYEDPSFFSRLFKREISLTPAQYRRRFGALRRALEEPAGRRTGA